MIDAPPPACAVCLHPSRDRVHPGCRDRIRAALEELPQLYRELAGALQPGRRGGDGRTGTRNPPLPCNTEALDLRSRGGIEGVVGGCGHILRVTLDTPGTRCPDCGAQYGHTEALRLPLAERRAA